MTRRKTALIGIVSASFSQIWTWCLALIEIAVVPRLLGAKGIGSVGLAESLLQVVSILVMFGGGVQIIRAAASDPGKSLRLFWSVITFRTVFGLPLVALFCFATYLVTPNKAIVVLVALYGLVSYLTWNVDAFQAYRRGNTQFVSIARSEMVAGTVGSLSRIGLVLRHFGNPAVPLGDILGRIVNLTLLSYSRSVPIKFVRVGIADIKSYLQTGLPFFQYNVCLWLYGSPTTVYFISGISGLEANGWFTTCIKMVKFCFFFPAAVVGTMLPLLSRTYEHSREEYDDIARRVSSIALMPAIPLSLLFLFCAHKLVFAFGYPASLQNNVPILLQAYGFGLLPHWMSMYYGMLLIASNRPGSRAKGALYVAPFNLALTALAVLATDRAPRIHNGALGGVIITILTEIVLLVIYLRGLQIPGLLSANLNAIGRGLLAGIVPSVIFLTLPMPSRAAFVAVTLTAMIAFFPAAVLTGAINRAEVAKLVAAIRSRRATQVPSSAGVESVTGVGEGSIDETVL